MRITQASGNNCCIVGPFDWLPEHFISAQILPEKSTILMSMDFWSAKSTVLPRC